MATFSRILSRVLAILAIALIALIAILLVDGQNLTDPAGAIWAKTHGPSLLAFQNIVQRHLGLPGAWDDYIVPVLEQQAWMVMVGAAVVMLLVALLFATFGRERPQSGNAFRNVPPE
ncbi:MAG: hypothetical protein JSU82_14315 [Rhodospirillales bacterium]|nr:MAG: hypothetical protein JSU82_14315 [Rhodospirillales bacterium]